MPRIKRKVSRSLAASPRTPPVAGLVDATPEKQHVRSFVRRVNEWIIGERRRDEGLLRTLQGEHVRSGDAAWKDTIAGEIDAADHDMQAAVAAFERHGNDEAELLDDDDDGGDDADARAAEFERTMDAAAANASREIADITGRLASQASALRAQFQRVDEVKDEPAPPPAVEIENDDDNDNDEDEEFFDVDEDLFVADPHVPQIVTAKPKLTTLRK